MRHRRHRKPDCRHRIENCGTCGEKGHTSKVCRSGQSTSANARAVEVDSEDTEEDPIKEIHDVWTLTVCTTTKHTLHESSEDNLSVIMDSAQRNTWSPEQTARVRRGGGEGALLQPAQVRLRSATCDDMEVLGGIVLRGKCSQQAVEITALVADQATSPSAQRRNSRLPSATSICDKHSPYSSTNEVVAYHSRDVASETTSRNG